MSEPTRPSHDAASLIFNLPDYRVVDAIDLPDGRRRLQIEATEPAGCPSCGVVAVRVRSRRRRRQRQRQRQRVRDIPIAGPVEVVWRKRRWFCDEVLCERRTFWEWTGQVPRRARSTARLGAALVAAVVESGRAASETARAYGVSWWLVQAAVTAAVVLLPDVDTRLVGRLGIDEHRYRSVRFFREPSGTWRRFEPWMSTIVDIDTGQVLGVVDGRDSTAIGAWLAQRSRAWRDGVQVVAIDPSAAFRKALREQLPRAAVSVDPFHLVKLAGDMLTTVRQRLAREHKQRRGRLADPSWANRRLLRGADTLTTSGWARLRAVFAADDPTDELGAAWGVKEHLRMLLRAGSLAEAHEAKMRLGLTVITANMPETSRLFDTVCTWWDAIEVRIVTGATNARTEAANTSIKHIKRTGRGFRNDANYRARIPALQRRPNGSVNT